MPKYVALKIIMARFYGDDCPELKVNKLSQLKIDNDSICLPLDQFKMKGPNGEHWCFVYPLAGPPVSSITQEFKDQRTLQSMALQAVKALASLHSHGICHGDFIPRNVLVRMTGLDGLSEEKVIEILGEPIKSEVTTYSGQPLPGTARKYLVDSIDFYDLDPQFLTDQIYVIDFGESFDLSHPPKTLGTPRSYCAPELLLGEPPSIASDLWALACTLFTIRMGRKIIDLFDNEPDDYLYFLVLMLGPLPEPWWSTTWEGCRDWFQDEPDSEWRAVQKDLTPVKEIRAVEDLLKLGVEVEGEIRDISQEEVKVLGDLLRQLTRFRPEERLSIKGVQEHEWFSLESSVCLILIYHTNYGYLVGMRTRQKQQ
ncbi:hypothetical protein AWENTII_012874 [Aspergillus wentii]